MKILEILWSTFYEKFIQNKTVDELFHLISIVTDEYQENFTYLCKIIEREKKCFECLVGYCFDNIQSEETIKKLKWINILSSLNISKIQENVQTLLSLIDSYESLIIDILSKIYTSLNGSSQRNLQEIINYNLDYYLLTYPSKSIPLTV